MSYGGIGSILSSIGGMAITPAMETYIHDVVSKGMVDNNMLDWLGDPETQEKVGNIAGGTLGTLLSTGLNAGLGYATGGKEGAAAGAAQGLIMGGGAALQHEKFKEALGMGDTSAAPKNISPSVSAEDPSKIASPEAWKAQSQKSVPSIGGVSETAAAESSKTEKPESKGESKKPGYFELTGELGMPAWAIGAGLGSSMDYANRQKAFKDKLAAEKAAEAAKMQQFYGMLGNLYAPAYAEGGMAVSSNAGVPTKVTFPDWFIEEFANTGGLGAYAMGGYVNPQQFDPDTAYPQSMIHRAEPYPAASPIRNEVVNMEKGGLLEGPGDGMSDHIPANISGKESVRVADGEYVVPAAIAQRFGEERLHAMMDKVRAAAHAKKGKQIVENAGKRAFIQTMSRVKA